MDSLQKRIKKIYEDSGYQHIGETTSGLKFSNAFSRHFVFVLPNLLALQNKWKVLHGEVVKEYIDFRDDSFLEWNFYCAFVVEESEPSKTDRTAILEIEQDRSYSRKYVLCLSELDKLPPGLISCEDFGGKEAVIKEMSEQWNEILGERLYKAIMSDTKQNIEKRLLKLLGEIHD